MLELEMSRGHEARKGRVVGCGPCVMQRKWLPAFMPSSFTAAQRHQSQRFPDIQQRLIAHLSASDILCYITTSMGAH